MKSVIFLSLALFALGIGEVVAATGGCAGSALNGDAVQTLLAGKYACQGSSPTATWNELHIGGASGNVQDYKKGPTDPVDPTAVVGTYAIAGGSGEGTVIYNYGAGGTYTFVISGTSSPYLFCGPSGDLSVNVQPGPCCPSVGRWTRSWLPTIGDRVAPARAAACRRLAIGMSSRGGW